MDALPGWKPTVGVRASLAEHGDGDLEPGGGDASLLHHSLHAEVREGVPRDVVADTHARMPGVHLLGSRQEDEHPEAATEEAEMSRKRGQPRGRVPAADVEADLVIRALEQPPQLGLLFGSGERLGDSRQVGLDHAETAQLFESRLAARHWHPVGRRADLLQRVQPACQLVWELETARDRSW